MARFIAWPILLLLAGCAAAKPMTYLSLAPVPGAPVTAAAGKPITVAHVEMPPSIDRLALTTESGPSTLDLDPNATWAAPLGEMATQVLAQDLASRLPGSTVLMPGEAIPAGGARVVRVDVLRFLPINEPGSEKVVLDANWQMLSPGGAVLHGNQARIEVPSGPGAAAEAEAMSTALGQLADRIAAALGAH